MLYRNDELPANWLRDRAATGLAMKKLINYIVYPDTTRALWRISD